MVTKATHLLIVVLLEHIGEMADTEAHLGAKGGGEELARNLRRIDRLRRLETIVAIAASLRRIFAEVTEQDRAAAAGRLDQRRERVQPFSLGRTAFGLD